MHLTLETVIPHLSDIPRGHAPVVFCDMDGVVADFERTYCALYKCSQQDMRDYLDSEDGWFGVANRYPNLFLLLDKMPDADTLMRELEVLAESDAIYLRMLTALPGKWIDGYNELGFHDKYQWMEMHYGIPRSAVCITRRSEKALYAQACVQLGLRPILIDDLPENIAEWEAAGGVGILHTSAHDSVDALYGEVFARKSAELTPDDEESRDTDLWAV